jgi:hypothetical protein
MTLPNCMSFRPGLLWLTLNLALIIQCLSWNNIYIYIFFNFTYPLRCLRVPQVEYHWPRQYTHWAIQWCLVLQNPYVPLQLFFFNIHSGQHDCRVNKRRGASHLGIQSIKNMYQFCILHYHLILSVVVNVWQMNLQLWYCLEVARLSRSLLIGTFGHLRIKMYDHCRGFNTGVGSLCRITVK